MDSKGLAVLRIEMFEMKYSKHNLQPSCPHTKPAQPWQLSLKKETLTGAATVAPLQQP